MARRRFFVPQVHRGEAELRGDEARHLTKVLRVEPGQKYEITDNDHAWLAEVVEAHKERVLFRVIEPVAPDSGGREITLYAALVKFDRFELLVEKATELGVTGIVPLDTARTERGLAEGALKRLDRWRRIAREASQQSRRTRMPGVAEPLAFAKVVGTSQGYFFDETREAPPLLTVLRPSDRMDLMIGPEGGWTDNERGAARAGGWVFASLGPHVLRAETAALAALAVVQCAAGIAAPAE